MQTAKHALEIPGHGIMISRLWPRRQRRSASRYARALAVRGRLALSDRHRAGAPTEASTRGPIAPEVRAFARFHRPRPLDMAESVDSLSIGVYPDRFTAAASPSLGRARGRVGSEAPCRGRGPRGRVNVRAARAYRSGRERE
jgi:hypothetical protein